MGYLETCPEILANFDFHALKCQLYDSPNHLEMLQKIPFNEYEIAIFAFSLMSIQIPHFEIFMIQNPHFFSNFHSNSIIIVGGAHATANPQYFIPFPVDFVIQGEGEIPLSLLLSSLIQKNANDININSLQGVSRISPSYLKAIPQRNLVDIGAFPPFSEKFRLFAPIEISRGCPFRCKFCQTGNISKHMRHVPLEQVIHWIKRVSEIKFDKVWFLTPNAFAYGSSNGHTPNPLLLEKLLSRIRNEIPKIKKIFFGTFPSEVRPESVTQEVLQAIHPYIDNNKITIGAQTASNDLLKKIKRGHSFEDVLNAIELLANFQLTADIDFIFGLPGESLADQKITLSFFREVLAEKYPNVRIHTHTFMPLPGTPFECEQVGTITPEIEKIVGKLALKGKAYGEYQNQAKIFQSKEFHE